MIRSDETAIEGRRRIEDLVASYLEKLGSAEGGWSTLYKDSADGRLWELTYPHSEMHGGGPPVLRVLSRAEAEQKFTASLSDDV